MVHLQIILSVYLPIIINTFCPQQRSRPQSAGSVKSASSRPSSGRRLKEAPGMSAEDKRIVVESKDEYQRRGGWMRIFPSALSMEKYGLVGVKSQLLCCSKSTI